MVLIFKRRFPKRSIPYWKLVLENEESEEVMSEVVEAKKRSHDEKDEDSPPLKRNDDSYTHLSSSF